MIGGMVGDGALWNGLAGPNSSDVSPTPAAGPGVYGGGKSSGPTCKAFLSSCSRDVVVDGPCSYFMLTNRSIEV
jgi:hypothetical protein